MWLNRRIYFHYLIYYLNIRTSTAQNGDYCTSLIAQLQFSDDALQYKNVHHMKLLLR